MKKNILASIIFVAIFFIGMFAGAAGSGEADGSKGAGTTSLGTDCGPCAQNSKQGRRDNCDVPAHLREGICDTGKKAATPVTTKPSAPATAADKQ